MLRDIIYLFIYFILFIYYLNGLGDWSPIMLSAKQN